MLYKANDHPKWWHYYKHAKKYRVRKKYRRRLEQQLCDKLLAAAKEAAQLAADLTHIDRREPVLMPGA